MFQTVAVQPDFELIDTSEDCLLTVWQERYPDHWLLIGVTSEDDGEPLTGRLLAVAATDMVLAPLWQTYTQQGKIIALLYGRSTAAGPMVVA